MAETEDVTVEVTESNPSNATPSSIEDLERKMKLTGEVKRTELYGAFVDIGVGTDAILHVSQVVGGKRIQDVLKVGEQIDVYVDKIEPNGKVMVTMHEPLAVDWQDLQEGNVYTGKIVRHENFGSFVDIGAEKEGLVHVSEISNEYIRHPSQAVSVGDEVEVKVLSFDRRKRRINLSIKALLESPEKEVEDLVGEVFDLDEEEEIEEMPTAMEYAIRQAMGDDDKGARNKKKKKNRKKRRQDQDDIIGRTLEYSR